MEKMSDISNAAMATIIAGIATSIGWLVRRVLTDSKKVAILEAALEMRDKQREEDRQDLKDVKTDIKDIKSYILEDRR